MQCSSSGRLLKPFSRRQTDRFVYSTKGAELLGLKSGPMIDLTISPSVTITKLDLLKHKIIVNTPVHCSSTIIQTVKTELGCLGNNNSEVSAVLTAQPLERVKHGSRQDNHNQSNKTPALIKHRTRHVCYRKCKAAKKPDAIKNEQASNEVAMPTNGKGPCQIKEACALPRTGSPLQVEPVNWTNGDDFKLSRLRVIDGDL